MKGERVEGNGQAAAAAMLTRGQVARRLGVAVASVRRLEGTRLHPRRDGAVWLFDPAEVEQLAIERANIPVTATRPARGSEDGELAAEVFALFDLRRSFSAIVRHTRQPPALIRKLHLEWRSGFGDCEGPGAHGDRIDEKTLEAQRARDNRELHRWQAELRRLGLDGQDSHEEEEPCDSEVELDHELSLPGRQHR